MRTLSNGESRKVAGHKSHGIRPAAPGGTYALILFLPRAQAIAIGALGSFVFPRGYYVYVGSAMNGLPARLARHKRRSKELFWHIDYFRRHARWVGVQTVVSRRRWECRWARAVLRQRDARIVAARFGASDCRCRTHLIYFDARPRVIRPA